jgi:hypothetical protein
MLRERVWAAAAIGAVAVFIAISCWWLSRDLGVPSADAASHLFTVVGYHDLLARGDAAAFWTRSGFYPPLTFLVGALSTFVGSLDVASPVIGENLVYGSLLAAGCYGTARLLAGARAGFLAVIFALGSPLLIEQFHVFMIDAPEAAMVATAVWLILASERFSRVGVAALAGLVVGLGLSAKEQFPLFVAGLLIVVLVRGGGWRNWRGVAAFACVALVIAAPWYVINWGVLGEYATAGLANANLPARGKPDMISLSNLGWYMWAVLNGLLFAPLFAFAAVGVGHAVATLVPRHGVSTTARTGYRPELLGGLLVGWLGITLTPHHDMRYAMPLIVYLAVLGTIWIASLAPTSRRLATAGLSVAVIATMLGASFGAGHEVRILLAGRAIATDVSFGIPAPGQITIYSDHDFMVSAPRREADLAGLFAGLRSSGITGVSWADGTFVVGDPHADAQGIVLLARFAGLAIPDPALWESRSNPDLSWNFHDPHHAFLIRGQVPSKAASAKASLSPACLTFADHDGLWVTRGHLPGERGLRHICPDRDPSPSG